MRKWKVYKIPRNEGDLPVREFIMEPPAIVLEQLAVKHGRIQMEAEDVKEETK